MVAATNVNVVQAVETGKFREDLYYRLNTVPIKIPPLRERVDDIHLLFRKFTADFADKFQMPPLTLTPDARAMLERFRWPGNVRQLKNITEQLSILEENRIVTAETLRRYLPENEGAHLPAIVGHADEQSFESEREILYKVLFDMKNDMNDLKRLVHDLMDQKVDHTQFTKDHARIIQSIYSDQKGNYDDADGSTMIITHHAEPQNAHIQDTEEFVEESLSREDKDVEMIRQALQRHNGMRKYAAEDLGISERTLYRKIKEHTLE